MSTISPAQSQSGSIAPPYPAAITISGPGWRSALARDGHIPLAVPMVRIGRMESNEVVLTDPLVSRHHSAIRWAPNGYEIEDLGSANGTYLDGVRVNGRMPLTPGQTIRIGNTELAFNALDVGSQQSAAGGIAQQPYGSTGSLPNQPASSASPYRPATTFGSGPGGAPSPQGGYPATQQPQAAGASAYSYPYPYYGIAARRPDSHFMSFFKTELRKRYWRVFLIGLLAYIVLGEVLGITDNLNIVPLVLLLASALVPVVFVIFCWEQSAFVDMPPAVVAITFFSGAILGLAIAGILEPIFIRQASLQNGLGFFTALLVGIIEESAKVISVLWFLRDRRVRSELDGLILGAAAGMGFAAMETAGYGFNAFLTGFIHGASLPGADTRTVLGVAIANMNHQLWLRMATAIFGHGTWTAIVCAAIWRERGSSTFRLTPNVVLAFAIAVLLHALWDWQPLVQILPPTTNALTALVVIIGWFLIIGFTGIFFLRFFLRESLQRAKLGSLAPPPPPLLEAIWQDTFGGRSRQHANPALAYGSYGYGGYGPSQSQMPQAQQAPPGTSYQAPAQPIGRPPSGAAPTAQQQQPAAQQSPPPRAPAPGTPPIWPGQPASAPSNNGRGALYCPRCNVRYPAGTQACPRCRGQLNPLP